MTQTPARAVRWLGAAAGIAVMCSAVVVLSAASGHDVAPRATPTIWDGVYTAAQADRGQRIFTNTCAACHGDDLNGTEDGPSLRNAGFFARWRAQTVGVIVTSAMKTMPKGAPGSLSVQEYVEIASFLLRANGAPAGNDELPDNLRTLRTIAVTDGPAR